MADASYVQHSFLGGLWSKSMQGRVDRPDYRTALNECLNSIPLEQGALQRRSGTLFAGATRLGAAGRVISLDFRQSAPYTIELTDGHMRFRSGGALVTTNDVTPIASISTTNSAVVTLVSGVTWQNGDQGFVRGLNTSIPLLQNRQLLYTRIDAIHFAIFDAIANATIDGSTLGVGSLAPTATLTRILDLPTPWSAGTWADVRVIPTDIPLPIGSTPGAVMLHPTIQPYILEVLTQPSPGAFATFSLTPQQFTDGPYFDPVPGGTLITPNATNGIITMTLSFNAYDPTIAYSQGSYVTSSSVNYRSLIDANLNNTPASSPTAWVAVTATDAISPNGFTTGDIGRHIRLLSAPALWLSGTNYSAGNVVAYNPTGAAGAETYWQSLVGSNTGNVPGTDLTHWEPAPSGAIQWTWGKITGPSNQISGTLSGSLNIGTMTGNAGLSAAFDGVLQKTMVNSASLATSGGSFIYTSAVTLDGYVGKNYSGASTQKIAQATVFPTIDDGFLLFQGNDVNGGFHFDPGYVGFSYILNLRAKQTTPASASDGTLLGSSPSFNANSLSPVTIVSNDQATSWNYVWIEIVATATFNDPTAPPFAGYTFEIGAAQVTFYNPLGPGTGQGVTVQLVGPALLNTTAIRTWRLGLYSNGLGWPACGTYHEGRLWLSGAVPNRIDGSVSNQPFNFAPTNADGSVSDSNAIDYTFNAPDVNPIFWMAPEGQGIVCGTQAGEWLVQATTISSPLSPTNIQAHRQTRNGSANIEPRRTEHTLVVVQRYRRKIMEYFADVFSGKYSAQNIIAKAKQLTEPFIAEVAYQQELAPIVWARMDDGSLAGVTYKRDSLLSSQEPTMAGAHRHTLGSGRIVQSIAVGPSPDGNLDSLTMVTNDPATNVHHVEIMQPLWDEDGDPGSAWFLDDALQPISLTTTNAPSPGAPYGGMTIGGFWHLNGKTVQVVVGGIDCGMQEGGQTFVDFAVTNGQIFVPFGDGVSAGSGAGQFTQAVVSAAFLNGQIVAGFTYNSDAQITNPHTPPDTGARNGPGFGKLKRHQSYGIKVYDSCGMQIGTDFSKMLPIPFKDASGRNIKPGVFFQGTYWEQINDDYARESMICWRTARPYPTNVAMVGGFLHTQDQ